MNDEQICKSIFKWAINLSKKDFDFYYTSRMIQLYNLYNNEQESSDTLHYDFFMLEAVLFRKNHPIICKIPFINDILFKYCFIKVLKKNNKIE